LKGERAAASAKPPTENVCAEVAFACYGDDRIVRNSWLPFGGADCAATAVMGQDTMSTAASAPSHPMSTFAAFRAGFMATWTSIFAYVLLGTYLGIGAISHDFGFSIAWTLVATVLVWAGPAQVILVSTLGSGGSLFEVALAVGLSGVRLLPMVVSMLPLLKRPDVRTWKLVLPAHFTAVSIWVEALRLLPAVPRERRIPFINGLGSGYSVCAIAATLTGYHLAAGMPVLLSAGLLFLTPLAFLMSTLRNARMLVDLLALAFGLVLGPLFAHWQIGLDLMWSGIVGGTAAYAVHRVREALL
jgi:predicted branched-subunit amino acid permease